MEGVNTYCFHWVQWHMALPHHWVNSFWVGYCWDMVLRDHWRCQEMLFPPPPLGWNSTLSQFFLGQVVLGMRSQEGCHIQLGWLLGTLKVSTGTVPSWFQWQRYFPTIGLELNLDLVLSEGVPRWNAIAEKNKNKIRISSYPASQGMKRLDTGFNPPSRRLKDTQRQWINPRVKNIWSFKRAPWKIILFPLGWQNRTALLPTSVLQVHPRTLVSPANHMKHGKHFFLPDIPSAVLSSRCSF